MYFPERPLDPPEPALADVTVDVDGYSHGTLDQIMRTIGGEAYWSAETADEDGSRAFKASTVVEDCEDYSTAEDIVHNLFAENLAEDIDMDNLIVTAPVIEIDEPDYDAIWKDERNA